MYPNVNIYINNLALAVLILKHFGCLLSCFAMLQIGFEMIDVFAESVGIQMNMVNFKAVMGQGME